MARSSRYESLITIQYKTLTSDGFGGVVPSTAVTVVSGYSCSIWKPSIFQVTLLRTEYGMAVDAEVIKVVGEYNTSIREGYQFTYDGSTFKIRNVTHVRGAGNTLTATTLIAERAA